MRAAPGRRPAPGWLLDEVASAGRENLDAAHVGRYDGKEDGDAAQEVALLRRGGDGDEAVHPRGRPRLRPRRWPGSRWCRPAS